MYKQYVRDRALGLGTEEELRRELAPGERLLWSGHPVQGLCLRASDGLMIPFSLMWGGFAIFWQADVITSGAPLFFGLWGVPFVLVGLYITVGRFFYDSWQRARTYYGVTDQRALILSVSGSRKVKSLPLARLEEMELSEKSDGSGTIKLGRDVGQGKGKIDAPAFEFIDDSRRVHDLMRDAQQRLAKSAPAA